MYDKLVVLSVKENIYYEGKWKIRYIYIYMFCLRLLLFNLLRLSSQLVAVKLLTCIFKNFKLITFLRCTPIAFLHLGSSTVFILIVYEYRNARVNISSTIVFIDFSYELLFKLLRKSTLVYLCHALKRNKNQIVKVRRF